MTACRKSCATRFDRQTVLDRCLEASVSRVKELLWRDDRGSILLETVVASMVFAMVGVAVLSGLSNTYRTGARVDVHSTAENVARNQIEHVFNSPFEPPEQTPYPTYIGIPAGYSVVTTATEVDPMNPDPDIERVEVTVSYDSQEILSVNTLRFQK